MRVLIKLVEVNIVRCGKSNKFKIFNLKKNGTSCENVIIEFRMLNFIHSDHSDCVCVCVRGWVGLCVGVCGCGWVCGCVSLIWNDDERQKAKCQKTKFGFDWISFFLLPALKIWFAFFGVGENENNKKSLYSQSKCKCHILVNYC